MFSRWTVTNITSDRGTLHCRKTRIPCGDQLVICGLYSVNCPVTKLLTVDWRGCYVHIFFHLTPRRKFKCVTSGDFSGLRRNEGRTRFTFSSVSSVRILLLNTNATSFSKSFLSLANGLSRGFFFTTAVTTVSGYGLDDQAIGVRSPVEAKDFSSSLCVQTGSGAHPASCTVGTGVPFTGAKGRPGCDADHSPYLVPSSRMSRSYTSSPPKCLRGV
jgi:hypothetical protein